MERCTSRIFILLAGGHCIDSDAGAKIDPIYSHVFGDVSVLAEPQDAAGHAHFLGVGPEGSRVAAKDASCGLCNSRMGSISSESFILFAGVAR